jgi:ABC-type phosphate transport system substrate-binding protein
MRAILILVLLPFPGESFSGTPKPSFAVIVHPSNSTLDLRFADLQALFSGNVAHWPNGSKAVLVEGTFESATYKFVTRTLLNISPNEYRRRRDAIEYSGTAPVTLKLLNSDRATCKFVYNVPGSIGVIESSSLDSAECHAVTIVRIDGKLPTEEGYRFR